MSGVTKAVLFGLLVGISGVGLTYCRFLHDIEEDTGLGLLFRLRGARAAPAEVVVVSIDKESADRLQVSGIPARWPRSTHARLVDALVRNGAQVIIFDVYFTEPGSTTEDQSFGAALKRAGNVVLAEPLRIRGVPPAGNPSSSSAQHLIVKSVKPIAPLLQAAVATAPFVLPRLPVKVNQYWTFQTVAGDSPTFPAVALQLYAMSAYREFIGQLRQLSPNRAATLPDDLRAVIHQRRVVDVVKQIRNIFDNDPSLGAKMTRELDRASVSGRNDKQSRLLRSLVKMYGGEEHRYLNYYGPPRTLKTIPYHEVVAGSEKPGHEKPPDLTDKAVFVGLSETMLSEREDSFYTVFARADSAFISGVEIAATAFANLLEDRPVRPIDSSYYLLVVLVWGMIVGVFCRLNTTALAALGVALLSAVYLITAEYEFRAGDAWYPIAVPLFIQGPCGFFGALLWNFFETNRERQNIRKALGYYVPDEMVRELARNRVDIRRAGHTVYGACLFADAAGYTELSETMGPQKLTHLMHKYFEAAFEPIKKNGGIVLDLKGDSILAIWKAPRSGTTLRRQACQAALGVAKAVQEFNRSLQNSTLPTRISIHAGPIFLGNIGAADHYEYGATGDTVNTASRIDGLNKYLGTEILVSAEALRGLDDFATREAGKFLMKGKTQSVVVHELISRIDDCPVSQKNICVNFAGALESFRKRSWDEAEQQFKPIAYSGNDGLARFYLERCRRYRQTPPPEGWDGVIALDEK